MNLSRERMEVAVVGCGPAGLCAAMEAARTGAEAVILDENHRGGGQLFKQIHRFFGSHHHGAGKRGYQIAEELARGCLEEGVELRLASTVLGFFESGELMVDGGDGVYLIKPEAVVLATGAIERSLAFPGWTLPGVMGAGAAQTLVNMHGVLPGRRVLMAGAGNVGLIVSYQLLQAGAEVVGLIDVKGEIGGYRVHAERVRREGVLIYTRHRLVAAEGETGVEAVVAEDVEGGDIKRFRADCLCMALGLIPVAELAAMRGCGMSYQPGLGGFVPRHGHDMRTDREGVYVAGDAAGVEEASVAMEEGRMAGISAAEDLGRINRRQAGRRRAVVRSRLEGLRGGPYGWNKAEIKRIMHNG
ncbi:MAG: NAD(P)/FAD-dependent oxidoreductase [Actinomycetota bacterium]|nr:NAD(P)/FAD-dependent oxidoreductase [Actinomycetota bacterium]